MSRHEAVAAIGALALFLAGAAGAAGVSGHRIDLERFTVDGVGLRSTVDRILSMLGPPEEKQKYAGEEKEEQWGEEVSIEKRKSEKEIPKVAYSYFKDGIKITFNEADMSPYSMEFFISGTPPYEEFRGTFVQSIPLDTREIEMLRPLARQIYKDSENALYLKKDESRPLRESAKLSYNKEGWLTKVTFKWEENIDIDIDGLCVGGVCLGDRAKRALETFGPPDDFIARGKRYVGKWKREGLTIYAKKRTGKIYRIVVAMSSFSGAFAQPGALTARKGFFHDYLAGRIYQEGARRICAYRKGEPLSDRKLVLKFDENERLIYVFMVTDQNIKVDLAGPDIAGLKVGDSARRLRRLMGPFSKWRELRDGFALAFPRWGTRVEVEKSARAKKRSGRQEGERLYWSEIGDVRRIDTTFRDCLPLYAVPVSLAKKMDEWEEEARDLVFRRRGDFLYLSRDGRPPADGAIAMVEFERIGWPRVLTLRRFRNIVVDMEKFTVSGIGLGTHADEVLRLLGQPDKSRALKKRNLAIFQYMGEGLIFVIDRRDRSVAKIVVDMEEFEGEFVQNLTVDSSADDYEKVLYREIYAQDERRLWLTRNGEKPTWDEAVIHLGYTGRVEKIVFQTLAVKKEGLLEEITRELE